MLLHKLKITRLTHLEAGQLIKSSIKDLETAAISTVTDTHVDAYVQKMAADSILFDKGLLQIKKNQETEDIAKLDAERDVSLAAFNRQLKVYELDVNPNFIAAYKAITIVVKKYKNLAKLNYEAESNGIDNLVDDLISPAYAPYIATLELDNFVSRIKNSNTDFKLKFSQRNTEISSTEHYDMKSIRKNALENYNNYTQYVLSLAKVNSADPYYTAILNIINQSRKYYSDMLAKRDGGIIILPASTITG
ncbi:DUF6261 family protein [Flavobacterium sp.]|jgi:hypothetical protein|uniref:DUF6261 family protein n=1 Tax=Flavobacterium sp. TaxID=239 RepID=UPI0037BFAC4A